MNLKIQIWHIFTTPAAIHVKGSTDDGPPNGIVQVLSELSLQSALMDAL
jgi:hypothetical protein